MFLDKIIIRKGANVNRDLEELFRRIPPLVRVCSRRWRGFLIRAFFEFVYEARGDVKNAGSFF